MMSLRRLARRILGGGHKPVYVPAPLDDKRTPLRCAVLGLGVMGMTHAETLRGNHRMSLAAIVSRRNNAAQETEFADVQRFSNVEELLEADVVDVLIIATPHKMHCSAAVTALQAGVHVICEKPMAASVEDCDRMVEAASASKAKATVVSQNRFEPSYRRIKDLLDSGELGEVRRCTMIETFYRPNSYYDSADWRGTWDGEGGGVLVNQAPHVLDRYLWFCGMPKAVSATCDTVLHSIAVEDTATLTMQHESGAQGQVIVNTTELPRQARVEVICDRGRIEVIEGAITIHRLEQPISAHAQSAKAGETIESSTEILGGALLNWSPELLHQLYDDFAEAVWTDRQPEVSTASGAAVVELINAAYVSEHTNRRVSVPVDREEVAKFFREICDRDA